MVYVTIPKGEKESYPITLAHFSLAAIQVTKNPGGVKICVLGSFDGKDYYPVQKAGNGQLSFSVPPIGAIITFDPNDFEGPQFVKFQLESPAEESLDISYWPKDF